MEFLKKIEKHRELLWFSFVILLIINAFFYWEIIIARAATSDLHLYFLNVGQGDSELAVLPGGVKVLIDGGPPNGRLLEELGKALPATDRYIDLVMMSHPQLDHFGGFIDLMKRYRVGAFLENGREGTAVAYKDLKNILQEKQIPEIILKKGDSIQYGESIFHLLWPNASFLGSKELNDACLVAELESKNSRTLYTGDIGQNIEDELIKFFHKKIDILKIPHHGSRFSSSPEFLGALKPTLGFIEVGKNTYGHPTKETLTRLGDVGVRVYRTDQGGTKEVVIDGKSEKIFSL